MALRSLPFALPARRPADLLRLFAVLPGLLTALLSPLTVQPESSALHREVADGLGGSGALAKHTDAVSHFAGAVSK